MSVKIKPLQWVNEPPYLVARVMGGWHYSIEPWAFEDKSFGVDVAGSFLSTVYDMKTIDEAKSFCERDYNNRVSSLFLESSND